MTGKQLMATTAVVALLMTMAACKKAGEFGTAEAPVDTAAVATMVKANVNDVVGAFNDRNAEKATSYDAPDYVSMMHGTANLVGKDADLAANTALVADPNLKLSVSNESVDVAEAGDMATYRATYSYTFTDPKTKAPATEVGNWLIGFKKQPDGTLKMAWGVVSDTPAAAATAP